MYRQCLLRLMRSTRGLGSSSSTEGLKLASALTFERFLGFFFFFFFCATVASSSTRDKASSRGGAETVELVRDGLIEGDCSTSWKMSIERSSRATFAMRVRVIGGLTNAVSCSTSVQPCSARDDVPRVRWPLLYLKPP